MAGVRLGRRRLGGVKEAGREAEARSCQVSQGGANHLEFFLSTVEAKNGV